MYFTTANIHSTPSDLHFRARERTVDFGQYVLLRNDVYWENGSVWSRSRAYTAPLEDLWRQILKRVVPSDPVENARGLLELYDGVVKSFHPKPMTHRSNWTPAGDWYSRLGRTRELSKSLHLELQFGQVESRRQRYGAGRLLHLNEPRRGTSPFHLALAELPGVDSRRVLVTNRLCRLVPQAELALLVCLVDANLVNSGYQNEVRERQKHRLEAGDQSDFEFCVVMTAVTEMYVRRAVDAICDYLNLDDDRVAAAAESMHFPEFEHLEPAVHY